MDLTSFLKSLVEAGTSFTGWWKKAKGDVRALAGELKENMAYLEMVAEDGVALDKVIDKISIVEYKRLSKEGFNFNTLRRDKIDLPAELQKGELASWQGKETEALVVSIYDKLNELKIRYPHVQHSTHYRWHARVNNIRKRIWLLFMHVGK